jgi:hypothetical protein
LTPIEASSECLLETQKDGSNFLIVDYKLQSDSTHDSFVIWAGSDTDLTGKALEDLETYQANAERLLDNTDISGNSSHSLTLTYENDVTESRRVVIWAVRQYASDGVSTIGDPEILTECTVTVGGK